MLQVNVNLEALRTEKDSLKMELYEGNQYKDEVVLLKKEKDRLSDKVDTLWKELKDHQDVIHTTEKEHLDLRQELESQIRDKDEEIKTLKIQITSLEKSRYVLTYLKKRRSNFDKNKSNNFFFHDV